MNLAVSPILKIQLLKETSASSFVVKSKKAPNALSSFVSIVYP